LPNTDPDKITALKGHMIFDILAFLLTVIRIILHRRSAQPNPIQACNSLLDKSATIAHIALNVLVLIVSLSCICIVLQAGLGEIVFLGDDILPINFYEFTARIVHGVLTKVLIGFILLHVTAALYHQFIIKDEIFMRVSLFKR
jgi:cytochrome b561